MCGTAFLQKPSCCLFCVCLPRPHRRLLGLVCCLLYVQQRLPHEAFVLSDPCLPAPSPPSPVGPSVLPAICAAQLSSGSIRVVCYVSVCPVPTITCWALCAACYMCSNASLMKPSCCLIRVCLPRPHRRLLGLVCCLLYVRHCFPPEVFVLSVPCLSAPSPPSPVWPSVLPAICA